MLWFYFWRGHHFLTVELVEKTIELRKAHKIKLPDARQDSSCLLALIYCSLVTSLLHSPYEISGNPGCQYCRGSKQHCRAELQPYQARQ